MANTLALRGRIKTAQNVSKTTRAMQMIAASKLKRAQLAALAGKPYVEKLSLLTKSIASRVPEDQKHEYMKEKQTSGKTLLFIFSPDKGLCGGLVTNLIREYLKLESDKYIPVVIGKKLENYTVHIGRTLIASFPFGITLPEFAMVYPLTQLVEEYFLTDKVDKVEILSTRFDSLFSQKPRLTPILPLTLDATEEKTQSFSLFEPKPKDIIPSLLSHYVEMVFYQALLENFLAEQAARMVAMQNATTNAKDIIEMLTLEYNKARQEKITSEILDISSAANT